MKPRNTSIVLTILTALMASVAIAADDPPKPFWRINYEKGLQAQKRGRHADVVNYFTHALEKAVNDKEARKTEVIPEMYHAVGISYRALAEAEENNWSRKTKYMYSINSLRSARSWYTTLRGVDDPIIMEINHELAEAREAHMLLSNKLSDYMGQRPDTDERREGVWETYLKVLADKEKRLGPDDPEVIKYRRDIQRKIWKSIRRMRDLVKVSKNERRSYDAQTEIDELEKLADELKEANKSAQEASANP